MHLKKVRLEFLSRAKMAPQRQQRKTTAEWMNVQVLFPPPKLWQATARQTRRYLWAAMATGTRLFQMTRIIRKHNQMVQTWPDPRSRQDDMLREYEPMLITLMRQSHIIIVLMPVVSCLLIMTAEPELTMTVTMKITTNVHGSSVSWFTVTVVLSSNFRHLSILRQISKTGAERWRPTML